ncbi:MAG: formylglycine-generating enzyme family protein [Kiritimatiellae bacterium]|nr:formylglycine-generating enzyme family protein [Kiritimatiellia bacterium]
MMKPSMKKYIVAAFVAASMTTVYAQSAVRDTGNIADAYTGASRERRLKKAVSNIINNMVAIPGKNFKMGKYEVTQAQWQAVMGDNPSHFKGADNPVEKVSWNDCKKFLEKLNSMPEAKASGLTFRLPTEKEWEYACRAGSTGDYCKLADGTEITSSNLGEVAWYDDNSERKTHPVGQKKPNAFGLYDMHGNVWEWCEDLYQAGYSYRVLRGGGWLHDCWNCAADNRVTDPPGYRYYHIGFRLAASQD